jgi:hypothetical protein
MTAFTVPTAPFSREAAVQFYPTYTKSSKFLDFRNVSRVECRTRFGSTQNTNSLDRAATSHPGRQDEKTSHSGHRFNPATGRRLWGVIPVESVTRLVLSYRAASPPQTCEQPLPEKALGTRGFGVTHPCG